MCWRIFLLASLPVLVTGCASTTVRKNPAPEDKGIRYYLPKPYLKLEQAKIKEGDKITMLMPEMVMISMEMLPDFSEEYSVHVRAGVGINNTKLFLDDGWRLKEVNCHIESNTDDNLRAITAALSVLPTPKKDTSESDKTKGADTLLETCVQARNVPLGYYEAVLTPDTCGRRQFHGWRYVGFAPFAPCPLHINGVQVHECHEDALYALIYENKTLVFKKLCDVAKCCPSIEKSTP